MLPPEVLEAMAFCRPIRNDSSKTVGEGHCSHQAKGEQQYRFQKQRQGIHAVPMVVAPPIDQNGTDGRASEKRQHCADGVQEKR